MKIKWYRKYWSPWGKVIGFHDIAFLKDRRGKLREVWKMFDAKTEKFVLYSVLGDYADTFRFKRWRDVLRFLHGKIARYPSHLPKWGKPVRF